MATVTLSQLKAGDQISEDVLTSLGSVLFQKGKVVTQREIEIMEAFLVSGVEVNRGHSPKAIEVVEKQDLPEKAVQASDSPLHDEYDRMIQVLRHVFSSLAAGSNLQIGDLRKQLERVLEQVGSYNLLTFTPRYFSEKDYMLHNSVASALTSYQIAQWASFPQKDWMQIALAGLLHDIGNIRIDMQLLMKPTALTAEEKEEMKKHPTLGYQLLKNVLAINEGVKLAVLQHHEKVDGTGYPLGIDSSKIHPYAKIVAIADIFHAMTLNKAYRKAASPYLVLEQIQSDAFGKLDPTYVGIFVEKATQFHSGTIVKLSDGRIGEIVFTESAHPTRPWVSVNGTIVNLTVERKIYIEEVIK